MTTDDREIAGEKEDDKRLWRTYFHWARCVAHCQPLPEDVKDKEDRRLPQEQSESLQLMVFSAFLIEYRMKRAMAFMGQRVRSRDNLGGLIGIFWPRLSTVRRCKGEGHCAKPAGWDECAEHLRELWKLRCLVVHANYADLLAKLPMAKARSKARDHYNNVVEAMKLINRGTGYSIGEPSDADEYWNQLKCREQS